MSGVTSDIAIAFDDISATYVENGNVLPVIDDFSLEVPRDSFVALVGPSGCGKTTLLDIASGLLEPDAGSIRLNGASAPAHARLGQIGYMRQRDLLLPWRTALDNAAVALQIRGQSKQEARAEAGSRLDAFGLEGFADSYPAQLSGGMRQRVAFLRTTLGGQSVLLLDEPFGSLDALTRIEMQDWLIQGLAREARTVILVTHDVEEAIFLADRVVVLSPRPARIVRTETIWQPRPRDRSFLTSAGFLDHRASLLEALGLLSAAPL